MSVPVIGPHEKIQVPLGRMKHNIARYLILYFHPSCIPGLLSAAHRARHKRDGRRRRKQRDPPRRSRRVRATVASETERSRAVLLVEVESPSAIDSVESVRSNPADQLEANESFRTTSNAYIRPDRVVCNRPIAANELGRPFSFKRKQKRIETLLSVRIETKN